jgi:alkylhydroperoxidase/carboxymuconolactone decarboxylase family protein YurZ
MPENDLTTVLAAIRDKRGYLLAHHGLMALAGNGLLEAYDALYTRLTLTPGYLSRHEHELVWTAVLMSLDEPLGTHHIPRYLEAGGSREEFADILAISALAKGVSCYQFVEGNWLAHLPDVSPQAAYRKAFERAAGDIPLPRAHLAATAVHTCLGNFEALAWQIRSAYAAGTPEQGLAEALSIAMFPGGVPYFARASEVWRRLIAGGDVEASAAFRAWADLAGQGGYDEASGLTG